MGCTEAEFLDVIGTKSSEFTYVLFTATSTKEFYSPLSLEQKWFESGLLCNVNIVNRNLKSENYQGYAQKSQQYCMFMSSASV
jgi:hypothetical protein